MRKELITRNGKRSANQGADCGSVNSHDFGSPDVQSAPDEGGLASDSELDQDFVTSEVLPTKEVGRTEKRPSLCCLPTMAGANPDLPALSQPDWEFLFQQTLLFAHYQVQRLRWRRI